MAAPNLNGDISGYIAGDDLDLDITITNVPSGQTLVEAWFTVKELPTDADSAAIIQKIVTTALDANKGVIGDSGADGTAVVSFYLLPADTILLSPGRRYSYDVQVKTSAGRIGTPEKGTIQMGAGVTVSTA